jgi:type IV secretory pathway VirB4 component
MVRKMVTSNFWLSSQSNLESTWDTKVAKEFAMASLSLTKSLLKADWIKKGVVQTTDGQIIKCLQVDLLPTGQFEEEFDGPMSDSYFQKLSELLTRMPNEQSIQLVLFRSKHNPEREQFVTRLITFENVAKEEAYSHLEAALKELGSNVQDLNEDVWNDYLSKLFGNKVKVNSLPDMVCDKGRIIVEDTSLRVLSLTELPQVTWKGCLQTLFESGHEFVLSFKMQIPNRAKIKKSLETKRRVSHALSVSSSLEVKNIESNSVLFSSEETLERILVHKETLFEISMALMIRGSEKDTSDLANTIERMISGVGNAGIYLEELGARPVLESHLPGGKILNIRKLPILSGNLAHILPLTLNFTRANDKSSLELVSRAGEVSHLNLFSSENLNFNSFICGASGSGKSFLMNAILSSVLKDEPNTKICIFDIGGSYRKIVENCNGKSHALTKKEAETLIASFLQSRKIDGSGFFKSFIETLCGSGSHITHSHRVAIDDLLRENEGRYLSIRELIKNGSEHKEKFYQEVAHWLKPHAGLDRVIPRKELADSIQSQIMAFDFKELDAEPVLQRTTILVLSELLWSDLVKGKFPRSLIIFDEVWRFFAQSKTFLEEMYRTLRKYKAGIVSITQNLADYGDEAFAKMIFTNSLSKIFLQNGASREILKNSFDLPDTDISRALSVTSRKPIYSEFFCLSPSMSQVFRLYPTDEFYKLANTENIALPKEA